MSLIRQLSALLEELAKVRDGVNPALSADSTALEPFGDEGYIYLEADLPGMPGLDIDISVHKTRALFRMERPPAAGTAPDVPLDEHRKVIGCVGFHEGSETQPAILFDDGQWSCAGAPHVAAFLNHDHPPVGDPTDDSWGNVALIEAARRLNGFAWLSMGRPAEYRARPGHSTDETDS
jgi:hypothetical protein